MDVTDNTILQFCVQHKLSKRQSEVLFELVKNPHCTSEEIAPKLACTPSTVNVHLSNIFEKVGVKNKRELFQLLSASPISLSQAQKLRILCVDDDPIFQKKFIDAVFQCAGSEVEIELCHSGLDALMYLSRIDSEDASFRRPDIITLDLVMPIMDGMTCLQKIKSDIRFANIPIVVFSSQSEKSTISQAYDRGGNSFVLKPTREKDLLNIVRVMIQYWGQVGQTPD